MNIKQVPLNDIDVYTKGYDRFLISYGRDLNAIMDSISKVGLITPVILKKNPANDRMYTIICGYQRISAFKKLRKKGIDAKIIKELNDEKLTLLSFHDNLFSRGFNEIEKAIAIKKFLEIGYSYDRLMSEVTSLLSIPPNKKILDKYLFLLKLDKEIKESITRNEVELEHAFLLVQFDDAERDIIYRILLKESITNLNEARETIRNLLDLKLIRQKGIAELLASREINNVLSDKKTNRRQKGQRVFKLIKSMRYPTISKKEDEFNESCRALGIDNNVRITHSRFFEGDEIQINLKVSEEKELKSYLEKLLSKVKDGVFKKIFSISE